MEPTRINDAKCALRNTVQAFAGQVNFGLATFSRTLTGCNGAACVDSCTTASGSNCADANNGESYLGNGCSLGGSSCGPTDMDCNSGAEPASPPNLAAGWDLGGRVVVPMLQDPNPWGANTPTSNVSGLLAWFDGVCDNRELFAAGSTPIAGALQTVHEYYRGGYNSAWGGNSWCASSGFEMTTPLTSQDPSCRSLNVILVTDGSEQCSGNPANAARDLFNTGATVGGATVPIRTHVIGFAGVPASAVDPIADRGDDGLLNNSKTALVASNEVDLAQAFATIISSAIRPENCNNVDDNCNGCIDEGY
ncbi:MAG: hypothetical protein KC492_23880, partial [Myxococcales bacterium]|nr:hypothetical protein [Myxococcales bacterium]